MLDRTTYVYLIEIGHIYKIGLSGNPTIRSRALRNLPRGLLRNVVPPATPVTLRHTVDVSGRSAIETRLHKRFSEYEYHPPHLSPSRCSELFSLPSAAVQWFCSLTPENIATEVLGGKPESVVSEIGWMSKHAAAELSGYNPRTLVNKAALKQIRAEQRGPILAWYFWRADIEALRDLAQPAQQ